ncbi:MAG TPA: AsmA family protein [Chitinispirillaceae bacterium]|nr:AsmA family protein [Chitinispirillaceae bacterium]
MGKKTKIVGITLGVILVAFIAILLTLWMMFPPEKLKALIIPQVEKTLGRKVSLEKASLSIFPVIGANLAKLEISNTERQGFSDGPFVKVDNLLVQIPIFSLLKKQPEISKIIIKSPQILLEIDSTGAFNFDDLAMMSKGKSESQISPAQKSQNKGMPVLPVPITLKELTIQDGAFTYRDNRCGQEFVVGDIDQTVKFSMDKELKDVNTTGDLVLSQVSVKTKEITKPLSNLRISFSHDIQADLVNGNADLKKVRLSFQKVFLNLTGSVSNFNTIPQLDLKIDSDPFELKDILAEIPREVSPELGKIAASGTLELDLAVKGAVQENQKLPVLGSLTLKDGMVKYSDLPKSIDKINTSLDFTDNSLDIKKLSMMFGSNPVELKGTIRNFSRPLIDLLVKADVDLGDLKQMTDLPKGASLSGMVKTDISAKGEIDPSDPSKLDVKGKADLQEVSILWPPLLKPAVINGAFTLSSKAIGQNLAVKIGYSSMKMDAAVTNYLSLIIADSLKKTPRPSIDFKITSPLLNFDEFLPLTQESSSPSESKSSAEAKTESGPIIAPLPGIDMKGTVNASKIVYKNVEMKNMQMQVSVVNDIADLDIKTGFASGTITERIHADLRNTKAVTVKNNLGISEVEVNDLLIRFGNFIKPTNALNRELRNVQNNLYGKINLKSELITSGGTQDELSKSLKGTINADLANGKISNSVILSRISGILGKFIDVKDIEFRNLKTTLRIEDQTVYFDDFKLQSDVAGDWDLRGDVGFDASLNMNIDHRMTKDASQKVLTIQNSSKSKLQGLLQGTKLSSASGLLENVGIPSDNEGRITLKIAITGSASDPKPSFSGFGKGSSGSSEVSQPQTPKQQVTQQVKNVIEQNKGTVEKKLSEEGKKVEEEIIKKLPVSQEQGQKLKSKATEKLKKLF